MCFRSIYRSAFVQSHSQSQARLMFVTAHKNGLHQNRCTLKKIHSLSTGGANSRMDTYTASPTSLPYVSKQFTALFHAASVDISCVQNCSTNGKLCILVKAQPSTRVYSQLHHTTVHSPESRFCSYLP